MPLPLTVVTGPQNLGKNNTQGALRGGNTGEAIISKYLPDYAQAGLDGTRAPGRRALIQRIENPVQQSGAGIALLFARGRPTNPTRMIPASALAGPRPPSRTYA